MQGMDPAERRQGLGDARERTVRLRRKKLARKPEKGLIKGTCTKKAAAESLDPDRCIRGANRRVAEKESTARRNAQRKLSLDLRARCEDWTETCRYKRRRDHNRTVPGGGTNPL